MTSEGIGRPYVKFESSSGSLTCSSNHSTNNIFNEK